MCKWKEGDEVSWMEMRGMKPLGEFAIIQSELSDAQIWFLFPLQMPVKERNSVEPRGARQIIRAETHFKKCRSHS